MQKIVLTFIVCLVFISKNYSQTDYVARSDNNKALFQLEWQLSTGNSRYLRDIASFLDQPATHDQALKILQKNTIFPTDQIALDKQTSKTDFYEFFYAYQKDIKYSHILQIYFTAPLEQIARTIESKEFSNICPLDAFSKLCLDLQNEEDSKKLKQHLISLKYLQLHKGVPLNMFLNCLELDNPVIKTGLLNYQSIQYFAATEDLKTKLDEIIADGEENPDFVNEVYNSVFGYPTKKQSVAKIKFDYNQLKKSGLSLRDTLHNRLEHKYKVSNKYFYEDVDFYGATLCTKLKPQEDNRSLIANLLNTKNPKALFYISAYMYNSKSDNRDLIKLLENLTMVKIIQTDKDEFSKDLLIYWAQHYNDYTWDESKWRFVSEDEKKAQTKNLERLMRRLNSVNDTIAIQAYTALTEGNPYEVNKLVNKYKKVMKKTNPMIPPLKYNFLETTTRLVAYLNEFDIPYKPTASIQKLLEKLDANTTQQKRIALENKILAIAQAKDIPALEYWGTLNVTNRDNSFSAGRIVELLYAKYWNSLKNNRQWLTHFIYKAALFKEFDGTGISKAYANIIDINDINLAESLENIKAHTSRAIVIDYIEDELSKSSDKQKNDEQKAIAAKKDLVEKLISATEIKYSQINQLLDFDESLLSEKQQTLSFIQKLTPIKDIRKIAIKEQLNARDLDFLKSYDFNHREIGSIMRFFNSEDPKENLNFALEAIKGFSLDDKAYVVNSLFRYQWFIDYVNTSKSISQQLLQIISILSKYLKESEFIGEFEDRTTQINIIQTSFIGRSIEEQLVASIEIDVDLALKSDLQKTILAKAKFEDLGVILDHLDGLINNKGNLDLSFLNHDFGLPIFDISTNTELQTFLTRHKTLSLQKFYILYLKEFGLDFLKNEKELDFDKICKILKYDIAQPFIGRGGGNRDYYIYGLTKILEKEFGEDLGFKEKLNNYQTFVSFSSISRASAWYKYLISKGYGKEADKSPSFNQ